MESKVKKIILIEIRLVQDIYHNLDLFYRLSHRFAKAYNNGEYWKKKEGHLWSLC